MGLYLGKEATVWVRALVDHQYEYVQREAGSVYLAHEAMLPFIVDTAKWVAIEPPPPKAKRAPKTT